MIHLMSFDEFTTAYGNDVMGDVELLDEMFILYAQANLGKSPYKQYNEKMEDIQLYETSGITSNYDDWFEFQKNQYINFDSTLGYKINLIDVRNENFLKTAAGYMFGPTAMVEGRTISTEKVKLTSLDDFEPNFIWYLYLCEETINSEEEFKSKEFTIRYGILK